MRSFVTAVFILAGVVVSVDAQIYKDNWTLGPNWVYNQAMNNLEISRIAMQGELLSQMARDSKAAKTKAGRVNVRTATGPTAFKINKNLILPKEISDKFKGTAKERTQLKANLEAVINDYASRVAISGYPPNDLSMAFTYFIFKNYLIYKSIRPMWKNDNGEMQYNIGRFSVYENDVKGTYLQVSRFLRSKPSIKKMSDREKQKVAEYLAISSTLMYLVFRIAEPQKNIDMKQIGGLKSLAAKNLKEVTGMNAERLVMSNRGISTN